jgi:hypothetical protein
MVRRILELAIPVGGKPVPVTTVATRGVKPSLAIVETKRADPPVEHARQAEEREAAVVAPHAASPPRRSIAAPAWSPDEDDLLREAYAKGERIDLLAKELGRTEKAAYSRAKKIGLTHPREIKGGFVTKPKWSDEEDALLRALYGEAPTKDLPARIGRSMRSIYQRAFELDLKHGYQRQWSRSELKALKIAHCRGLAVADVAHAMGRKAFSVSKYATNQGYQFGRRPLLATPITLEDILRLEDSSVPAPPVRDPNAERALRLAAKAAPKPKPMREAKPAAVRQTAAPVAPREPALPAPPEARAHPIPVRPLGRPSGIFAYAERMRAAVAHLRARNFTVQRHSRDEIIARWHISGWNGLFSNEQLVELAVQHGLELRI